MNQWNVSPPSSIHTSEPSGSFENSGKRKGTQPVKKSYGTGKCNPICFSLQSASVSVSNGHSKLINSTKLREVGSQKPSTKHYPVTRLLYNGKRKIHANILCQLRSGINRLNKYLARINAVESDQCRCGRGEESVDHFLFRCPRWSIFRGEIRRLAGRRCGDTSYLLGGWSGEPKDGNAAKWKPANEMVTATINFAIATGRLEDKRKGRGESNDEQSESE